MTTIGAMGFWGMSACVSIVGSVNEGIFTTYLIEILLPVLQPGTVLVMDNLSVHCSPRVRELIERAGCELILLPPYSPDFSPIEEAYSKMKTGLKRAAARTVEGLFDAVAQAIDGIHYLDAWGWFLHAGYCR